MPAAKKKAPSKPTRKPKPAAKPDPPQTEVVSIDTLLEDPANVRRRDEQTEQMLEASLRTFKPFRSIGIDADGITRAGNGTLKAARNAGVTEVLVVRPGANQLVAVQRDDLSPSQLTAYSIADNRLGDRATNDESSLAAVLRSLESEDFDLTPAGYGPGEVDALCERLGDEIAGKVVDDPAGEWQGMPEFEHEDKTADAAFIIRVFLKDAQDLEAFGTLLGKDLTGRKFVWFSDQPHPPVIEVVDQPTQQ